MPADGSLPERRPGVGAGHSARPLRPRAVLRQSLRVLRLQHLHVRELGTGEASDGPRESPTVAAGSGSWRLCAGRDRGNGPGPRGAGRRATIPWSACTSAAGHRRCCRPVTSRGCWRRPATSSALAPDAEITTEANPGICGRAVADRAARSRLHPSVARDAERPARTSCRCSTGSTNRPAWAGPSGSARAAGFDNVSLDLIYGTPGESPADWQASLDAALALGPDHVSAYALVVEPGTRLARRVARGEVAAPDDDDLADKYLLADATLEAAGLGWYEVSNWGRPCRHNLGYWLGANWWGIGPGAHSHVGGVRWWNVKHPAAYARRAGPGQVTGTWPRGAGRSDAPRRARAAGDPPRCGPAT